MKNNFPNINFIGNKQKLSEWICNYFPSDAKSIFDAFSGGGSVSYEAKKRGLKVISNDIQKINFLISKALIENNNEILNDNDIFQIFQGKPFKGYMFNNFSRKLFFPEECMELDLYRANVNKINNPYKRAMALILLRRAMIRKMPYSRFNLAWDKIIQLRDEEYSYEKYKRRRAYHNQSFKYHFLKNLNSYNNAVFDNNQKNISMNKDVFSVIKEIKTDIVYLDPPYSGTMNDYFSFYGVIDQYIENKKNKPFKNNFIDKKTSVDLFNKLFNSLGNYKYWLLSYNDSSFPDKYTMLNIIRKYSKNIQVADYSHVYKLTGKKNKLSNKELLFIVKNSK